MPGLPEQRWRAGAVIGALKEAGVRVKNWKSVLSVAARGDGPQQESRYSFFSFGRDLVLLPQCHVPEVGGLVPKFLVDACEFLSHHLHTEGIFRKTGSLSRVRSLRVALEQGESVFCAPRSAALHPCDVATLVKQFLRELPSPLIPSELQEPLCRAQGLEPAGTQYGGRNGLVLLVTTLFPPSHARALRYFCTFLRSTAARASENRMEVGNLALVIAPNLLHCPPGGSKLSVSTEKLLDRQTEVIKVLIANADHIGVVPAFVMESVSVTLEPSSTTPPMGGAGFQDKAGLSVYSSVRRQRRRSVGEMFVEAFSKLKTGRTPNGHPHNSDSMLGEHTDSMPPLAHTAKRKSTDDTLPEMEGSAKKRRSIHDLREEALTVQSHLDESTAGQSPAPSESSLLSSVGASEEQEVLSLSNTSQQRRLHKRNTKMQRVPAQENGAAQRKRRSLRFFTLTSWSSPSTPVPANHEADKRLISSGKVIDSGDEPPSSEEVLPFKVPVILIEGPGRVLVGREMEDDPDLLNCSFTEEPLYRSGANAAASPAEGSGRENGVDASVVVEELQNGCDGRERSALKEMTREVGYREVLAEQTQKWPGREGRGSGEKGSQALSRSPDVIRRASRPPRRSISLPDVTKETAGRQEEDTEAEEGKGFTCTEVLQRTHRVLDRTVDERTKSWNNSTFVGREVGEGESEQVVPEPGNRNRATGAEGEGPGLKRSGQRMSVAEHVHRFNMLMGWMKVPHVPPTAPTAEKITIPQQLQQADGPRGAVRLRRQGARRFSRSISHEGVSVLLQGQNTVKLPVLRGNPPLNMQKERPAPLPPISRARSSRRKNEQLQPGLREMPRDLPHVSQNLVGERPPQYHGAVEQTRLQELGRPHCIVRLQKQRGSLLQIPEQEKRSQEMELHQLLELQLQLRHSEKAPGGERGVMPNQPQPQVTAIQAPLCIPPQQEHLLFHSAFQNHTADVYPGNEPSGQTQVTVHVSQTPPPDPGSTPQMRPLADCRLQNDTPFDDTPPLSADGLFERGYKRADGQSANSSSVSPPGLQFQPPITRRQYRDSPRWPVSEIRISTWNLLQL